MILGNKCDIEDKRQISKQEGEDLASEYKVKFMETSAKANINVEEAFMSIAKAIKTKMDSKVVAVPTNNSVALNAKSNREKKGFWSLCNIL